MKNIFALAMLVILCIPQTNSQDFVWSRTEDVNQLAGGRFLQVDEYDNIYVCANGINKAYTIKYDKDGQFQFEAGNNETSSVDGMLLSNDERIYMAGAKWNGMTNKDGCLHVYKTDGTFEYSQYYNFMDEIDAFNALAIDNNGNAYVTGEARDVIDSYGLTIKYGATGSPQWVQRYLTHLTFDRYEGLLIDVMDNGDVFSTGTVKRNATGFYDLYIIQYDAAGNELSVFETGVSGYEDVYPGFTLYDEDGNIYIGGTLLNGTDQTAFIMKVWNGSVEWTKTFNSPDNYSFLFKGAFDSYGNIIACGSYRDGGQDALYVKVSPSGGLLHQGFHNGSGNGSDIFTSLMIKDEYIYFSGGSTGIGTGLDYYVTKMAHDFTTEWEARYNGFSNGDDYAIAMVMDSEGSIYLTGTAAEDGGQFCTTVKFTNSVGIDEFSSVNKLNIWPNPAASTLKIDGMTGAVFQISTLDGNEVLNGQLNSSGIDISSLTSGMYLLQLFHQGIPYYAKFVKQ